MKNKYNRGFTLIELLVVIAIIGILSSIVLVSLNTARSKGKDARIQAEVAQIRTALETDYNGSNYPTWLTGTTRIAPQPTAGNLKQLVDDIIIQYGNSCAYGVTAAGNPPECIVITKDATDPANTGYAIYALLPSATGSTGVFCIDSRGNTRQGNATYPTAAPTTDVLGSTCQP